MSAVAPRGYGWEGGGDDEPVDLVPIEYPPQWTEPERRKSERIGVIIALQAIRWTNGDKGKLAAYDCLLGDDRRLIHDVAATAGCSSSRFYQVLKELKALVTEWRAELTGEVSS